MKSSLWKPVAASLAIFLASCSNQKTSQRNQISIGAILSKYPQFEDPITLTQIRRVKSRIMMGLDLDQPEILVLATNEPIASAVNPRTLIISRGMLVRLQSEAELAFVLAHEIAHIIFHHDFTVRDSQRIPQEELEADKKALEILSSAGYDPKQSAALIMREARDSPQSSYPERVTRLQSLLISWAQSPLPGITSTREFDTALFRLKSK